MTKHLSLGRFIAAAVVVALPLTALSGGASAKATKASAPKCFKHPNSKKCLKSGGGTGSSGGGSGGSSPQITVTVDPNPLVETGQSEIHAVIQVETLPAFAGDKVHIDSSQLSSSCETVSFSLILPGPPSVEILQQRDSAAAVLDDDGNATVTVDGTDCAPGTSVVEADLEVAPFLTALTTLVALPPVVTPEGVSGYPRIGGVAQEVETGDTSTSGDSDIYAVFYVETNPVYAEQTVEIASSQLEGRCVRGWVWVPGSQDVVGIGPGHLDADGVGVNTGPRASTILDDDGNATFTFYGLSCAAGTSEVSADVLAGIHPTYVTEFTVDPPAPTI